MANVVRCLPGWFEWSFDARCQVKQCSCTCVVICAVGELKWVGPVVVNVKCDLQPGRVQHVVSKVRWSVVL